MLLLVLLSTLLFAAPTSAGGLGKFLGRKMLNGGDEGQADLGGNSNDIPLDLSTEATEPGAPTYFDAGSNEGRSSGGGGGAPTESVEEAGGKSAGSNPSGPSESEPAGSTAEPGQQEDEGGKSPHNAEGSGFVENGYAFLADAFNQGAIRIVPSRGGENPCHSNSPASTFFGQRYPGYFGGCLETQQNGR